MFPADRSSSSPLGSREDCNNQKLPKVVEPLHVSYETWGIFDVAYETPSIRRWRLPSLSLFEFQGEHCLSFARLLKDIWWLDRWNTTLYLLCNAWITAAPSLSLYLAYLAISHINESGALEGHGHHKEFEIPTIAWLCCGLVSHRVKSTMVKARIDIGGHLRSHFIPQLVKASLQWDEDDLEESLKHFPYPHEYAEFIPGWGYLEDISIRIRHFIAVVLDVLVLFFIAHLEISDAAVLLTLALVFLAVVFMFSGYGLDAKGYTFWTRNENYNRLLALFNMAFDLQYRSTLIREGLVESLSQEYQRVSDALGVVNADIWILGCGLPPAWYWGIAHVLMTGYPMAVYCLASHLMLVPRNVQSMALFQYALVTIRTDIDHHLAISGRDSIWRIMTRVQKFYETLERGKIKNLRGSLGYTTVEGFDERGLAIIAKNLTYRYPSNTNDDRANFDAIRHVNLEIEPGQVILITGANGSGKTTLVKLLTGMVKPATGQVVIGGHDLNSYALGSIREATSFIGQSEIIYPVSIRENILMGLGLSNTVVLDELDKRMQEAAHLTGAAAILDRHGAETILNPCSINGFSIQHTPGKAVIEALNRHSPLRTIGLSSGERQRLVLARAIIRAKYGKDVKLVILDEATNALDAIVERDIFTRFREIARERGQTLIVVTHRLTTLASHADQILHIDGGKLVERGTHASLIASGGRYSALFST